MEARGPLVSMLLPTAHWETPLMTNPYMLCMRFKCLFSFFFSFSLSLFFFFLRACVTELKDKKLVSMQMRLRLCKSHE